MKIRRVIEDDILSKLRNQPKAVIVYGPRQVGKTTLCQDIINQLKLKTLTINADEQRFIARLSSQDSRQLSELVEGYQLLFIDEAQRVPRIGLNLKILIDTHPALKIIATGSSAFELATSVSEPLTGRAWFYHLFPIAQLELSTHYNRAELNAELSNRLIWGSYPEMVQLIGLEQKIDYMRTLTTQYLYKDVLAVEGIRHPEKMRQLVQLLAFQIGNEVSLSELGGRLDSTKETIARYLELLEKTFVIFSVGGFSRNLRNEVTKSRKWYFYDVGVRNAVIDNFKPIAERNDVGFLWENFLIAERQKSNAYKKIIAHPYFWRTYNRVEIDYIEERSEAINAFEIKWSKTTARPPAAWTAHYRNADFQCINRSNWLEFVL